MASEEETKELSPICYDSLEHKKKTKQKRKKKLKKKGKAFLGNQFFLNSVKSFSQRSRPDGISPKEVGHLMKPTQCCMRLL